METPKRPTPVILDDDEDCGFDRPKPSFCIRCFSLPCFRNGSVVRSSSSSLWERLGSSHYDGRWWAKGLRVIGRIREWSELIAGPKWKTFIRRIRRRGGCRDAAGGLGGGNLNYDLANYALNFDEGAGHHDDDEFRRLRSFAVGYGGAKGKGSSGFGAA